MPVNTVLSAHCWSSSWLRGPDRRRAAEAELLRVPDSAERLRDHPGHWYGDGHHRHPHRPFGWFLGSLHRWCVCTADGTRRSQLDARHRHRSGRRPDRRRLAGFWVAVIGIPGFITTLAGMLIFRGLATVIVGESVPITSLEFRGIARNYLPNILGWWVRSMV